MTVSVRGGVLSGTTLTGVALGSSGPVGIAPADAPGTIVYWSIDPSSNATALKGFAIGDETVATALVPSNVQQESTTCVGCHTSTPGGDYASFTVPNNNWSNALAAVAQGSTGQAPPWLGSAAVAVLEQTYRGIHTYSPAHFVAGDRVMVTHAAQSENAGDLLWIDLESTNAATASGTLARTGDANGAGAPTWTHDGNTIAYVSTNALVDGRLDQGPADIYTIPYAARAGGTATPLPGASDPNYEEYYPVYAADDKLLAFDRVSGGTQNMYNNANAEVFVIPAKGGTATRLVANDPPACTGKTSPGQTNSWPKWAPSVSTSNDGRTFYWLVFSSKRDEMGNPQLYISPVVVDAAGKTTTYAALYLWNQPATENNHTPAWDVFKIPPPPLPK